MARSIKRRAHRLPFYQEPDRGEFVNPFDDREILAYYRQLYYWHGFIRFLGLPHLKDSPDVPIYRLFVPPDLSAQPIPVEQPGRDQPERSRLLAAVADHSHLVILGDPGSGKSTLVNWIAWQLSRSNKRPWARALGPLLPLPMIVRELEITQEITWDGLLDAFFSRPVARDLGRDKTLGYLERGQAFILLDGVDEIASETTRRALRDAVLEGVERYRGCRWLVTSRVVGYDLVPFHTVDPQEAFDYDRMQLHLLGDGEEEIAQKSRSLDDRMKDVSRWMELRWADVLYVSPFSDYQIEQFSHAWYGRHEQAPADAKQRAEDLFQAITSNHRTLRLARIPNLLTLMALIHRIQARLPHGRAVLYDKIVEAYLESIDSYRGLSEVDYSLEEKKRWLAYVGFRMQQRRSEQEESKDEEKPVREILVSEDEVVAWLGDVMALSPKILDVAEPGHAARRFVDYIARRSGLLLPRGEQRYAFTHLSFQEFFAALYLEERITAPRWFGKGSTPAGDGPEDLVAYADQSSWREPLVLLFGLLAGRPEWATELSELLFGSELVKLAEHDAGTTSELAQLLAEISVDPHSGLPGALRTASWEACWRWELTRQAQGDAGEIFASDPVVAQALFRADPSEQAAVFEVFASVVRPVDLGHLSLRGARALSDVSPLAGLANLEILDLSGTGVSDVSPLAGLANLEILYLSGTGVSDVSPLSGLANLEFLSLSGTGVSDVSPLAGLANLKLLNLSGTGVSDVSPLSGLANLEHLDLSGTGVSDESPLAGIKDLQIIGLPTVSAERAP